MTALRSTAMPADAPAAPRWHEWVRPLVALRHPILLAFVLLESWGVRSDADWSVLSSGGRALFGSAPLSAYTSNPGLQAGPPALVVVRALNVLPGIGGEIAAHLLLAIAGWLMLFLAERWSVPGATFRSAPVLQGLLTLAVGLPVLKEWAALAGALPHVEDGLALLTFVIAVRAVAQGRVAWAGLLVGLAGAWKPWAIVALPLLWGLPEPRSRWRALLIALAVPALCWLPFVVGDHSTLHVLSSGFSLRADSTLRVIGLSGMDVPSWWRTVELGGSCAAALMAALKRDWRVAFAAGCAARLLLDPAGFDYYVAGLVISTAVTERMAGLRPYRTALLLVGMVYVTPWVSTQTEIQLRFCLLALVVASWLYPWHWPDRLRRPSSSAVFFAAAAIPLPRRTLSDASSMANSPGRRG